MRCESAFVLLLVTNIISDKLCPSPGLGLNLKYKIVRIAMEGRIGL